MSDDNKDEINVKAQKFNVKKIGAMNSGSGVIIDGDVSITGDVKGTLKATTVNVSDALTVEKDTELREMLL